MLTGPFQPKLLHDSLYPEHSPHQTSVKCQCPKPQQTRSYDAKPDTQKGITSEKAWKDELTTLTQRSCPGAHSLNIVPCLKQWGRDLTSRFCHHICWIQPWKRSTPAHKTRQDLQKTSCNCFKPRNTGTKCHLTSILAFPSFRVFIFGLNIPLFRLLTTKQHFNMGVNFSLKKG